MKTSFFALFMLIASVTHASIMVTEPVDPENWIPVELVSRNGGGPYRVANDIESEQFETNSFYLSRLDPTFHLWDYGLYYDSHHDVSSFFYRNPNWMRLAFAQISEYHMPMDVYTDKMLSANVVGLNPFSDFSGDGFAGPEDLSVILESFGHNDLGDVNKDGMTNGTDFVGWQQQVLAAPAISSIPEPSAIVLSVFFLFLKGLGNVRSRVGRNYV